MNELNEAVDGQAKALAASFASGGSGDYEQDAIGKAHDLLKHVVQEFTGVPEMQVNIV